MPRFGDTNQLFRLPRASEQEPLTRLEMMPMWAWERRISTLYVGAGATMLGGILAHRWLGIGGDAYKSAVVIVSFLFLAWATVEQRKLRCPRCAAYVGQKFRVSLPETCKGCGVKFPREDEMPKDDAPQA
jgi:hypothetical protein